MRLKSMTAYGQSSVSENGIDLQWEIRTVNHRHLDLVIRLPEHWRGLEPQVRAHLSSVLSRGRIECVLHCQTSGLNQAELVVNNALVDQLQQTSLTLQEKIGCESGLGVAQLMAWPGVIKTVQEDFSHYHDVSIQCLKNAADQVVKMRLSEGKALKNIVIKRLEKMVSIVHLVRSHRPQVLEALRTKMNARLAEVTVAPDQDRLAQEMVFQAQRLDVDEELDRLDAHIAEVMTLLANANANAKEPVGRRLDFLMQELNREANTLSSKSADIKTTQFAVDLKVLIEQAREQIQNIE